MSQNSRKNGRLPSFFSNCLAKVRAPTVPLAFLRLRVFSRKTRSSRARHALVRENRLRTQSRAQHVRGIRTFVGYVPTYGGFGDTWRSHLNFPRESFVSRRLLSLSLSISHLHMLLHSVSPSVFLSQPLPAESLSLPFCPAFFRPLHPLLSSVLSSRVLQSAHLADVYSAFGVDSR